MENGFSKRHSLSALALLAFFAIGLFTARIIVKARQKPILSEPIVLPGSGISVSKPINIGWESTRSWQYESDNSLTLVAQQFQDSPRQVEIRWRYLLCSSDENAWEALAEKFEQVNVIFGKVQTLDGSVPMEYTSIRSRGGLGRTFYVGIAQLEFGRALELRVQPSQMSGIDAEELFLALAGSIQYTPLPELQAGKDLTDTLWETIATDAKAKSKEQEAFVIKDAQQKPIGFFHSEYAAYQTDSQAQLKIDNRQYETNHLLAQSTLVVDASDQTFEWKSIVQNLRAEQAWGYTVTKDVDGQVTVQPNFDKERQFSSSCLLVPELLLPDAVRLFLDHPQQRLVIDVLSASGDMVPAILEKINPSAALARSEDITQAVKVDFLNHRGSFEQYYYNADGELIGRLEQQPLKRPPFKRVRLWERTSSKELKRIFRDSFKAIPDTVAMCDHLEF